MSIIKTLPGDAAYSQLGYPLLRSGGDFAQSSCTVARLLRAGINGVAVGIDAVDNLRAGSTPN